MADQRDNGVSQPRQGRPKSYSDRDERSILRIIRKDPTLSYSQVKRQSRLKISERTLRRILEKYNIKKWIAAQRLLLTPEHARERLAIAKKY